MATGPDKPRIKISELPLPELKKIITTRRRTADTARDDLRDIDVRIEGLKSSTLPLAEQTKRARELARQRTQTKKRFRREHLRYAGAMRELRRRGRVGVIELQEAAQELDRFRAMVTSDPSAQKDGTVMGMLRRLEGQYQALVETNANQQPKPEPARRRTRAEQPVAQKAEQTTEQKPKKERSPEDDAKLTAALEHIVTGLYSHGATLNNSVQEKPEDMKRLVDEAIAMMPRTGDGKLYHYGQARAAMRGAIYRLRSEAKAGEFTTQQHARVWGDIEEYISHIHERHGFNHVRRGKAYTVATRVNHVFRVASEVKKAQQNKQ